MTMMPPTAVSTTAKNQRGQITGRGLAIHTDDAHHTHRCTDEGGHREHGQPEAEAEVV
jgi:hypothetical protein